MDLPSSVQFLWHFIAQFAALHVQVAGGAANSIHHTSIQEKDLDSHEEV